MPNVYVEPRPKGRPEGAPITDYVLELPKTEATPPTPLFIQ